MTSPHHARNPTAAIRCAGAVFVGAGNTFRLPRALRRLHLLQPIRRRVLDDDKPHLGSSAGTNLACPTICTTNAMPILNPGEFDALGLIPFQINPHHLDPHSTHQGETRSKRIEEFCEENAAPVLAMRERAWLHTHGTHATLGGTNGATSFTLNQTGTATRPRPGPLTPAVLPAPARNPHPPHERLTLTGNIFSPPLGVAGGA